MAPKKTSKATAAAVPAKTGSPSRTPSRSPIKKRLAITAAQKQALIDNLQLEITERARKLRAQYALHAQGLRSRLEMRINRVPQTLRGVNIEELINKYIEEISPQKKPNAPATSGLTRSKAIVRKDRAPRAAASPSPDRAIGRKRLSNEMSSDDKENAAAEHDLALPKKRAKAVNANAVPKSSATTGRQPSRKANPAQVLSPKSHNSRTLPQSPVKARPSPPKSMLARPVSPAKSSSTVATTRDRATAKASAPLSRTTSKHGNPPPSASAARTKRGAAVTTSLVKEKRTARFSDKSNTSESSNATTIVKTKVTKKTTKKSGIVSTVAKAMGAATGRKPAASKKENAPSASGGRALRSRK